MAEMQNTGNPIGSNDLKDLSDNLSVLDRQLNSEELTTTDRFGNVIPTVAGMRKTMEDLASQIATNELVPIDGSRAVDKLTLKDGEINAVLQIINGILSVDDINLIQMSDFNVTLVSNGGYMTMPSGIPKKPFILQWQSSNVRSKTFVTYPVTFPNALFITIGMANDSNGTTINKLSGTADNNKIGMTYSAWRSHQSAITDYAIDTHIFSLGW